MAQRYVGKITLQKTDRSFIPANTPFTEGDIPKATIDRLIKQGVVCKESDFVADPATEIASPGMRQLVNRIEETKAQQVKPKQQQTRAQKTTKLVSSVPPPANIWDADPAELQNVEFAVLYSMYVEHCGQYELTPAKITDKAELIKVMSADFKPKKENN